MNPGQLGNRREPISESREDSAGGDGVPSNAFFYRLVGGVFSAFWQIKGEQCRYMPHRPSPQSLQKSVKNQLLWGNFVGTPTALVRRDLLETVGGFDCTLPRFQDWDLFIRLSKTSNFYFISEPLVLAYVTTGAISENEDALRDALMILYKKNSEYLMSDKKLKSRWMGMIGDAEIKTGLFSKGRQRLLSSIRVYPLNIVSILRYLLSISSSEKYYFSFQEICRKIRQLAFY